MDLPIPFTHRGVVVRSAEIARPTAGDLAEVSRAAQSGDVYAAMIAFVVGGTASFSHEGGSVNSKQDRIEAIRDMPFMDANYLIVQILLGLGCDDSIDAVYDCPRCGASLIVDKTDGERIRDLPVATCSNGDPSSIDISLTMPVEIKNDRGEIVDRIESIQFRYPTMSDCSRAMKRKGSGSVSRMNLETLRIAMTGINGNQIDEKYRNEWSEMVLSRLDMTDIRKIGKENSRYGYEQTVARSCPRCQKQWDTEVDVSGFFASGLRELSA